VALVSVKFASAAAREAGLAEAGDACATPTKSNKARNIQTVTRLAVLDGRRRLTKLIRWLALAHTTKNLPYWHLVLSCTWGYSPCSLRPIVDEGNLVGTNVMLKGTAAHENHSRCVRPRSAHRHTAPLQSSFPPARARPTASALPQHPGSRRTWSAGATSPPPWVPIPRPRIRRHTRKDATHALSTAPHRRLRASGGGVAPQRHRLVHTVWCSRGEGPTRPRCHQHHIPPCRPAPIARRRPTRPRRLTRRIRAARRKLTAARRRRSARAARVGAARRAGARSPRRLRLHLGALDLAKEGVRDGLQTRRTSTRRGA
jgi:hypothetical protein